MNSFRNSSSILSLRIKCPQCKEEIKKENKNNLFMYCNSCKFKINFDSEIWDFRINSSSRPEFSKQWKLWSDGWLGSKKMLYSTSLNENSIDSILKILDLSKETISNKKFLDIGFGTGRNLSFLYEYSNNVFGIDLIKPIKIFKLNPQSLICGDLFNIPLIKNQFDVVICQGVIHHNKKIDLAFKKVIEQIKPGGLLYLYIYEKKSPKIQKIRKLFPLSWLYPTIIKIFISHILGSFLSIIKIIKENNISNYKMYHGNYTLGVYDSLSPRWVKTFKPNDVLSCLEKNLLEAKRVSPSVYIGKKK